MAPRKRPADVCPCIADAGCKVELVDAATVTSAMVMLSLAIGYAVGFLVFLAMGLSAWLTELTSGWRCSSSSWRAKADLVQYHS